MCLVCVCFGSTCLTFLLLRDDFESLKCCLDHWLYNMLDCIHICVFLFLKKLFLSNLNNCWTPFDRQAIYRDPSVSFYCILDSFSIAPSIHRDSFAVDTSQQILDSSLTAKKHVFNSQHLSTHLDLLRFMQFLYIYNPCDFYSLLLDLS